MSALEIKQRKIAPSSSEIRACDICYAGSGRFRVTIIDYDAGLICKSCKTQWQKLWRSALPGPAKEITVEPQEEPMVVPTEWPEPAPEKEPEKTPA